MGKDFIKNVENADMLKCLTPGTKVEVKQTKETGTVIRHIDYHREKSCLVSPLGYKTVW